MRRRTTKCSAFAMSFWAALALAQTADKLPHILVADARASAARFNTDQRVQTQFIDNYSRGALDALIWHDEIQDSYKTSSRACATGQDLQLRTIECGYADGVAAIITKKIAVTLEDFGYERATIDARVLVDAEARRKHVRSAAGEQWLLAPAPAEKSLKSGSCYRLAGYLGRRGALGARYQPASRAFIVVEAVSSGNCSAATRP